MAGAEAFLTGGISRKLHLHARRLRIDAPSGVIDVTAELPPHIAETLATLGFEQMAGDMLPIERPKPSQTPEAKQKRDRRCSEGTQAQQARRAPLALTGAEEALMHPNKVFAWEDRDAVLRFVADRAFAHIFTASDAGLFVVHAPVLVTGTGRVQFHLSRRNRIAEHLPGRVLMSISGREAYQSANWYVSDDQVPTWHYEVVEIEGLARTLEPGGAGRISGSIERAL